MDLGTFLPARNSWSLAVEAFMTQRRVDKERIERADRESKLTIEAERLARDAKTARLREQRLSVEASVEKTAPAKRRRGAVKTPGRKIIEVD